MRLAPLFIAFSTTFFVACGDSITNNEYVINEYNNYGFNPYTPINKDIRPPYLKKGDTVAVASPSNAITEEVVSDGIKTLKSWGLAVVESENLYTEATDGRYSGTLEERVKAMQKLIDNKNIKAIFFARGGYGSSQLLDKLDFSKLESHPKWVVGYSDITAFHIALNNMGIESIYGPMMRGFNKDSASVAMLHDALFGKDYSEISIEANETCVKGEAEGRLVGGNLSLIYSEEGTAFDLNATNGILFIEDVGEANYSIDRMILSLQLSGKLNLIKGVVVGEFTDCNQNADISIEEIVQKYFGDLNIPIIYGMSTGHDTVNWPLYLGANVSIEVNDEKATLKFMDR